MSKRIGSEEMFSPQEAAEAAGISKATLLRWLRKGIVSEPRRDRNGWRVFTAPEVKAIKICAEKTS